MIAPRPRVVRVFFRDFLGPGAAELEIRMAGVIIG